MENKYNLERFIEAQENEWAGYEVALREIKEGRKMSHWIWYIFPQLRGFGHSRRTLQGVEVASCGTKVHGYLERDEVMCRIAAEHGYKMGEMAVQATEDTLNNADIVVVMTRHHHDHVTRILKYDNWDCIVLFNDYCFGEKTDLSDSHFKTEHVYRTCFNTIERGCKEIIKKLKQ